MCDKVYLLYAGATVAPGVYARVVADVFACRDAAEGAAELRKVDCPDLDYLVAEHDVLADPCRSLGYRTPGGAP